MIQVICKGFKGGVVVQGSSMTAADDDAAAAGGETTICPMYLVLEIHAAASFSI